LYEVEEIRRIQEEEEEEKENEKKKKQKLTFKANIQNRLLLGENVTE